MLGYGSSPKATVCKGGLLWSLKASGGFFSVSVQWIQDPPEEVPPLVEYLGQAWGFVLLFVLLFFCAVL